MKAVKTNELKVGDYAAHLMDSPNCGGIEVMRQGIIERIEPRDMWGAPSDHLQLIEIKVKGQHYPQVITVHNSHTWLVRTL